MTIPKPTISRSTVMKMKTNAARVMAARGYGALRAGACVEWLEPRIEVHAELLPCLAQFRRRVGDEHRSGVADRERVRIELDEPVERTSPRLRVGSDALVESAPDGVAAQDHRVAVEIELERRRARRVPRRVHDAQLA